MGGLTAPDVTIGHVHPATFVLFFVAAGGFVLAWRTRENPMWHPKQTEETVEDVPEPRHEGESLRRLVTMLGIAAVITGIAGAAVAESAGALREQTNLSEAVVGGLIMALATSIPELVTSIAAVRRGALTLAVSDIVGGNFFDVLFIAAADLTYFSGSIYHADGVGPDDYFLTVLTILLNVIFLLGLVCRQKRGPVNIGFESVSMLITYICGFLIVTMAMQ